MENRPAANANEWDLCRIYTALSIMIESWMASQAVAYLVCKILSLACEQFGSSHEYAAKVLVVCDMMANGIVIMCHQPPSPAPSNHVLAAYTANVLGGLALLIRFDWVVCVLTRIPRFYK
jgi:hypothetical protein